MARPFARIVFKDEQGTDVAATNVGVEPFKATAQQSPEEFLGRDMRSVKVLSTPGTRRVKVKYKAMLSDVDYQIRDISENGRYFDMLLERTR